SSNWALTLAAQPRFRSSSRKARTRTCISAFVGGDGIRIPIRRIPPPCFARAVRGQALAAPRAAVDTRPPLSDTGPPPPPWSGVGLPHDQPIAEGPANPWGKSELF